MSKMYYIVFILHDGLAHMTNKREDNEQDTFFDPGCKSYRLLGYGW